MHVPPTILLTPNLLPAMPRKFYKGKALVYAEASMAAAVHAAGGLPLLALTAGLSGAGLTAHADALVERAHGLLLTGGADIGPEVYGEEPHNPAWAGQPDRDAFEVALYEAARARDLPVFGICRGAQLINVAEGGTLWQDLVTEREGSLVHKDHVPYDMHGHTLAITDSPEAAPLARAFADQPLWVNSVHHQGVKDLAPTMVPIAHAPDGVVEAFVRPGPTFHLAVQWHPEWMAGSVSQARLFRSFVDASRVRGAR